MSELDEKQKREIDELMARTRKTIAESTALVDQAHLRIAETDRMLAAHGLTREQVLSLNFTREQKLAANEELKRMGLPPFEDDDAAFDFNAATARLRDDNLSDPPEPEPVRDDTLAERQRKFGNFMQTYRI